MMKGDQEIIDNLNRLLTHELTAMDQYLVHAKMYEDWGFSKLHERIAHEFEDEKQHAEALIERILFLEGHPDASKRDALAIGKTVPEMLQNDLDVEYRVQDDLRNVVALCEKKQDFQTRNVLMPLLEDTEQDHIYWLEQQLRLIDKISLPNYLQSVM